MRLGVFPPLEFVWNSFSRICSKLFFECSVRFTCQAFIAFKQSLTVLIEIVLEGYDSLREHWTLASLAGTRCASSAFFHFIRNMSSLLGCAAPIIHSSPNPRQSLVAFPTGLSSLVCSPLPCLQNQSAVCGPPRLICRSHVLFSVTVKAQHSSRGSPGSGRESGNPGSFGEKLDWLAPTCCPHLRTPSTRGLHFAPYHSMVENFCHHIGLFLLL